MLEEQLLDGPRITHEQDFPAVQGWTFERINDNRPGDAGPTPVLLWSDERGLSISHLGEPDSERIRLSFGTDISMDVDLASRRVSNSSPAELTPAEAEHFLADQVYPRILAQEGAFILHAGSLIVEDRAVLIVGPSGRGKSTLIASFSQAGVQAMGDDACWVARSADKALARSLYPSLRLLPDSIEAIFERPIETGPVGPHTDKRRLAAHLEALPHAMPIAAIFSIAQPAPDGIIMRPMSIANACMTCVENSFALDPSDALQARQRLEQASDLAHAAPMFEIAYPRDYARLPEVRQAILDQVALLEEA